MNVEYECVLYVSVCACSAPGVYPRADLRVSRPAEDHLLPSGRTQGVQSELCVCPRTSEVSVFTSAAAAADCAESRCIQLVATVYVLCCVLYRRSWRRTRASRGWSRCTRRGRPRATRSRRSSPSSPTSARAPVTVTVTVTVSVLLVLLPSSRAERSERKLTVDDSASALRQCRYFLVPHLQILYKCTYPYYITYLYCSVIY